MRVNGFFKKFPLTILIYSSSTQNFIDLRIAKHDDCFIHPCSSFEVMIANGGTLPCKGKCCTMHISMGDYNLHFDMFSLPLGGCDVVLGAQWLCTLGSILWNFVELWMQFLVSGKKHSLKFLQLGLLTSSFHIEWKISLRIIHMVSLLSSIPFRHNH